MVKKFYVHFGTNVLVIGEIELTAKAPKKKGYPKLITLGDYLKSYRLDNNIPVKTMCKDLNIFSSNLYRWEENLVKIKSKNRNKIISFLGYDPLIVNKNK